MPKLKKKSHALRVQEQKDRRASQVGLDSDNNEKKLQQLKDRRSRYLSTHREAHNLRNKISQQKRLQSPSKRREHSVLNSKAQNKRLQSPSRRDVHRRQLIECQQKRLQSPSRRDAHRRQLIECQQKRLQSPSRRDAHRRQLIECQQKRLQSPSRRNAHKRKLTENQQKRLQSPSKKRKHGLINREAQVKRLQSPSKKRKHDLMNREAQDKRLQSPSKRRKHNVMNSEAQDKRLQSPSKRQRQRLSNRSSQRNRLLCQANRDKQRCRLIACQKKRLNDPYKKELHRLRARLAQARADEDPARHEARLERIQLIRKSRDNNRQCRRRRLLRLRAAQSKRLKNPVARLLHISRVLAAKQVRESKKILEAREKLYDKFISDKKTGPTHSCHCCHRLWFASSVNYYTIDKFDKDILIAACGEVEGDRVCLCSGCNRSIRSKTVPKLSTQNPGLQFPNIPKEIEDLSDLEERFLCPRIPFMCIRAAVSDGQGIIKGRAINIPINVQSAVSALPRTLNETSVVPIAFKRKKSYKSSLAFENVRPSAIKNAAKILESSPVFKHCGITVDLDRINHSEIVGLFGEENRPIAFDEAENEEGGSDDEEAEPVNVADEATLLTEAIVFAPGEGQKPDSLFAEFVEAQSFIKIYGGELISQPKDLTYQNWVKSEIMRDDRRCAYVTKLFFSASKLRTSKIASSISICLRKTKGKRSMQAQHALDPDVVRNLEIHDSGFRMFAPDRGSPAFWDLKKKELFAMLRQLGPPNIFLTLSPAETKWPELLVILSEIVDKKTITEEEATSLPYSDKVRLVKTDPVTVARYFEKRMHRFFKLLTEQNSVFREHRVVDYYIRTEFQTRGSPHCHSLLWLSGMDNYNERSDNKELIEFIDRFISCSHVLPPDLLDLQTHKHTFTCKKGKRRGESGCRFDIPFFPVKNTIILTPVSDEDLDKDNRKAMKLVRNKMQEKLTELTKNHETISIDEFISLFSLTYDRYINIIRSGLKRVTVFIKREPHECMTNFYNPEILMLHRANIDIQVVTDMYACATYILNYLNKSNGGMSKLLREALADIRKGNHTMKEQLRMLGNHFLNASEFSAQEAVYYILGLSLSNSSRFCHFINTSAPEKRVAVLKRKSELEKMAPESTDIFQKGICDHYVQRPARLEKICLAEFVALYSYSKRKSGAQPEFNDETDSEELHRSQIDEEMQGPLQLLDGSGYIRKRKKAKIIRFVNFHEHHDEYIRENVMLFWPWRNEDEMISSAETIFERKKDIVLENRAKYVFNENILRQLQDAEEENNALNNDNNDSDDDREVNTPQNLRIFAAAPSPTRDAPDVDIDSAVPRGADEAPAQGNDVIAVPIMVSDSEYSNIVSTLNQRQSEFLLHVLHKFRCQQLPFYHCVLGGAGVGKSRLIEALNQTILRMYNSAQTADLGSLKVLLCAPTGKAAFGIKGTTLHNAFVLPLNQCAVDLVPLSHSTRNTVWSKLHDVKLIIIDEISMVGSRTIQQVDCRLRQIFTSNLPFAGISVVVFGDFNQLRPVGDKFIFESHVNSTYGEIIGNPLWDLFSSYKLTEIMRQRDDKEFAEALNNLALGRLTSSQVDLFQRRIVDESSIPDGAIRLYRTNADVDNFNCQIIDREGRKIVVEADDRVAGQPSEKIRNDLLAKAKKLLAKDSQGLLYRLHLREGIRYMVTVNLATVEGLVNGAVGILKSINVDANGIVNRVWIEFPDEAVGRDRRKECPHRSQVTWTAIDRVTRAVKPGVSKFSVIRKQFPLVPAEAITICKSQGGTYDKVAFHFTSRLTRSEIYVALSRCTTLNGLYITGTFKAPSPPGPGDRVMSEVERLEGKQLQLACSFPSMFEDYTVMYHNVQSLTKSSHWAEFTNTIKIQKPDVFIAAETWTVPAHNLEVHGYRVLLRFDGGSASDPNGVVVYSKTETAANSCVRVLHTYSNEKMGERLILATLLCDGVAICTGYKPPSTPMHKVEREFQAAIDAGLAESARVMVIGDFNINAKAEPIPPFYRNLNERGFHNQLKQGVSTTNGVAGTAIDCIFSNFSHFAGVMETLYSYHKALVVVPAKDVASSDVHTSASANPIPSLEVLVAEPINALTLVQAIKGGKELFNKLKRRKLKETDVDDIASIKQLLAFLRIEQVSANPGKVAADVQLPSNLGLSKNFKPIKTTGDGNCFYCAISRLLSGGEKLVQGLRALVAYHMDINEDFLDDNVPLRLAEQACTSLRVKVLTDGNYAQLQEAFIMSQILRRPISIHTGNDVSSITFSPPMDPVGEGLHVYLDFDSAHYSALKPKPNCNPPIPDPFLPENLDSFNTLG